MLKWLVWLAVYTSVLTPVTLSRVSGTLPDNPRTVFMIVMENHNWDQIKGNAAAPYINNTLLALGAHAEAYTTPPGLHPSEPNYLWLEAGTSFDVTNDRDPAANHQASTAHLTSLLMKRASRGKATRKASQVMFVRW